MESEVDIGSMDLPDRDDLSHHDYPPTSTPAKVRNGEQQLLDAIEAHDHDDQVQFLREKVGEIDTLRRAIERDWEGDVE